MEKTNRGIMFAAAPAAMAVLLLGVIAPGTALFGAQKATTDSVGPHGYVVVTVTRDGQEIYRNEQHNLITNVGKDFISAQIGATTPGANGANYIALTTTAVTPAAGDTALSGEITTGGLGRAQGTYAHTAGQNTFTVSKTFTATASATNVQAAGLFTASSSGTMMAENTFTSVSLANNDQLTITWTITLS
jgi:hypothetical protein